MLAAIRRLLKPRTRATEAHVSRDSAAAPDPDEATALLRQAVERRAAGALAEAEDLARRAIDARHDYAQAHLVLGELCHGRGALEDAVDAYLLAACFAPDLAEPHLLSGLAFLDSGQFGEAHDALSKALEKEPQNARAHNAAGAALLHLERIDEARAHFEQAIALKPDFVEAHSNLGYLLFRDFELFEEGERHVRRARELAPDDINVLTNCTLVMPDRPSEVIDLCDRLLARDEHLDPVRLNRALSLLKLGEFERGWKDYEARKSVRCNYVRRTLPWPEWTGDDLGGRGIYVHTEQGLGDEIMFASCLPDIIAAADRSVIECTPKLLKLFRRSFGAPVVAKPQDDAQLPALARQEIDCHSAMGSLPRFLRKTVADFPRHEGYLRADPARVDFWRERLAKLPGRMKIGIAWRGGVPSTQRTLRSTTLQDWLPVLAAPAVDFIDLQHFDCSDERAAIADAHAVSVHRWNDAHEDYDETAALVTALDLVISVQTAIVHLSGALGQRTWALISAAPEWRYLAQGEHMPWYPSVSLFRQTSLRDWSGPMQAVAEALRREIPDPS